MFLVNSRLGSLTAAQRRHITSNVLTMLLVNLQTLPIFSIWKSILLNYFSINYNPVKMTVVVVLLDVKS